LNTLKIILLVLAGLYLLLGVLFVFFQERIIFQSEKLAPGHVFDFPLPYEERNVEMPDGALLNVVRFRADSAKGVILYFHGNAGSLARWGTIAAELVRFGYDVEVFDYRGYGKSTGKRTMDKLLADGQYLYQELAKEYTEERIVVFGRSLGSGMATWVVSQSNPRMLILETPFYSLAHVAAYHYPVFPIRLSLRYPFPNYQYMQGAKSPVFVFHGTHDTVVPYGLGQKLVDQIPAGVPHELVTIAGGGHNDLSAYGLYWEKMEGFLK